MSPLPGGRGGNRNSASAFSSNFLPLVHGCGIKLLVNSNQITSWHAYRKSWTKAALLFG